MQQSSFLFQEQQDPSNHHETLPQSTPSLHQDKERQFSPNKPIPKNIDLSEDTPSRKKNSSNYEEKVDILHMGEASQIKPSLFVPDGNASPIYPINQEQLNFKPHFEPPPEPTLHGQHARTLQLRHRDQLRQTQQRQSKNTKPSQEINDPKATTTQARGKDEKKRTRRLPSMKENGEQNPIQISQSSAIILPKTERNPQMANQSFQKLKEERIQAPMKSISQPVGSPSSFNFLRGGSYFNPRYTIITPEGSHLITATKQSCCLSSQYTLTISQDQKTQVGFLRGNFSGSQFNLYLQTEGVGQAELVATIIYRLNCSCWGKQFRYMEAYLKVSKQADLMFEGETRRKNLKELFDEGYNLHIERMATEEPVWSQKHNCFILNFGGKGKLPSVKNMILVEKGGARSLVFCKQEANSFHLQLGGVVSVFAAMGILLSSFNFKLLCQ